MAGELLAVPGAEGAICACLCVVDLMDAREGNQAESSQARSEMDGEGMVP